MFTKQWPVITFDGPSGVGKGTMAQMLAQHLHWHYLDSGALYRVLALAVQQRNLKETDVEQVCQLAHELDVSFVVNNIGERAKIILDNQQVNENIYCENIGNCASRLSAAYAIRVALLDRQHAFRQAPGLVTDGRDMGTVVFTDAKLKFFLYANAKERARRRFEQLQKKGIDVRLADLEQVLAQRDERDEQRSISPLMAAEDAIQIDSSNRSIAEVWSIIIKEVEQRFNFA